jgi:energy-coupling factor transport system ATP-binding protein
LLRAANGLVPHASGGRFTGAVVSFGRSTRDHLPRDLADVVGFVHQDPEAQFVVDRVDADVAFVLENLGVDAATIDRRVEEVLDALGIAHLRHRSPATLSGGERQRAAIAGALAGAPAALVLDEPTSQLDPQGAEDVLGALVRLNDDLGTTVLLAEHRLGRAAPIADRALLVDRGRVVRDGGPGDVLAEYPGAPEVTKLGRLLGWQPAPLTVKDARSRPRPSLGEPAAVPAAPGAVLVDARQVEVVLGGTRVLGPVSVTVAEGEVVALLGRNGAGKTTMLRALSGLASPSSGSVASAGAVAYVPQDPNTLLFAPTVRRELEHTLRLLGRPDDGTVDRWLDDLGLHDMADRHPRSLSGGERQRVAVGAVAVGGAPVLLLDETTRGMDPPSRAGLEQAIGRHAAGGGAVVLATHDVELAARVATRVIVLGEGRVVADGPARTVLSGSLFAPQVLRVLPPFLTVDEVEAALP